MEIDTVKNLPIQLQPHHPIFDALKEIQKPRTKFQLEKFVLGAHDTDQQKYKQCLLEIQSLIFTIQHATLDMKKTQIQIERLKASGDEIDAVEAEIKELGLNQNKLVMLGAQRELTDLIELWESFPIKYTYESLELDQPNYWQQRLTRQSQLEAIGNNSVNWSSLNSLLQIGELKLTNEENKAKEINDVR
jgi:hypothetical protein